MADGNIDLLSIELKKLTKSDLIDIIVKKMIPSAVNSDALKKFLENTFSKCENWEGNDVSHDSVDITPQNAAVDPQVKKLKSDLEFSSRLIYQLEKRTEEQSDLIILLKKGNSISELNINKNIQQRSGKNESMPSQSNTKTNKNIASGSKQTISPTAVNAGITYAHAANTMNSLININSDQHSEREKLPFRPRVKSKPIIGASRAQNSAVKTIPKQGHLHVYRLEPSVTSEALCEFLKSSVPDIIFTCEKLVKKNNNTSSFRVSFPLNEVEKVYNPTIWPSGAMVKRFRFLKNQNFNGGKQQNFSYPKTPHNS